MNFEQPAANQVWQLTQLWKEAFGEYDGFWELFLRTGFLPDHCRCITEDGQAIAGLYWFDCSCGPDKIAYIYAVVTDPRYRGRGLCRKLMQDVHAHLKTLDYASAMLVPADEGLRTMYRKLGYEDCTAISQISCIASQTAAEVRCIGVEEYGALRRAYLPLGGVLQEGISLTFLAAQAQLFAGENFLLAAYLEGETLQGMELLGNPDAAPDILRALSCAEGSFQIPGKEKPFAMIHKLKEDAVMPSYLGFSFD